MPQNGGIVRTLVIITTIGAVLASGGAIAAEVAISGNVSETLQASDNFFLVSKPSGTTVQSNTAGTLNFFTGTPDTTYLLNTNLSYYKYFGPGAVDAGSVQWGTPAVANFQINHVTALDRFSLGASWTRSDAAVTQLVQSGVGNARGSINTYSANAGVTHDLVRIDTISWTTNLSTVSFTDPTQTPYNDINSTILWAHTFSPTTTFTNSVNFDWFSQDNATDSQRLLWRFVTGMQSRLTPLLTFNGNIGLIFANAYQNGNAQSTTPIFVPGVTPFQPLIGAGHGWIGDVGLTYRWLKDTTVSFNAAQAVVPLFTGQLQQSSSLGVNLNRQINQLSNLSFFASYVQTTSPNQIGPLQFGQATGTKSDFFSAGAVYSHRLTREWSASMSYIFRENVTVAKASTVLFSLSKNFTLLGNASPINEAEKQRALLRAQQSVGYVFPGFY
jgi:hypothetical protein